MLSVIKVAFPERISALLLPNLEVAQAGAVLRDFVYADPKNIDVLRQWMDTHGIDVPFATFVRAEQFKKDTVKAVNDLKLN